eukprot:CAMPEP_0172508848 /NCGR_PEP_ID=MMETSP1066-20121228/215322_1 /TAXON_ID=671091 /ORGANISM="Coscinodiscus wailesii, Strain CCMP2513" /LENGTH=295 /DNA_ID=CAMNT_0013287039 /DNA_START=67 /DNA_END=954 /DNA_ORIENTATION=+
MAKFILAIVLRYGPSMTRMSAEASFYSPSMKTLTKTSRIIDRHVGKNNKWQQKKQMYGWLDNLFPKINDDPLSSSDRQKLYPEQYVATYELLDQSCCLPGEDDPDAILVRPLLKQTQLEQRPVKVVYDANKNGWSAAAFHNAVDGKGAAVVLAKTKDGAVIGGYNPKGWASLGGARPSVAAFLFYALTSSSSSSSMSFQKLRKVGGGGLACACDDYDFGISLGPDGLVIGFQRGKERMAQSKLGTYYERGPDELGSLFESTGGGCQLVDLKVLVGKYEDGEEIPYSGGVLDMTSG